MVINLDYYVIISFTSQFTDEEFDDWVNKYIIQLYSNGYLNMIINEMIISIFEL